MIYLDDLFLSSGEEGVAEGDAAEEERGEREEDTCTKVDLSLGLPTGH